MIYPLKHFNFISVLFFALLFQGCSTKNNNSTGSTNPLTGKWISDSAFVYTYDSINGSVKNIIYNAPAFFNEQYFQFNTNNSVNSQSIDFAYYDNTGSISLVNQTWTYTFFSDSILVLNNTDTSVISFTSNNGFILHAYHIQPYANGYTEYYFFR